MGPVALGTPIEKFRCQGVERDPLLKLVTFAELSNPCGVPRHPRIKECFWGPYKNVLPLAQPTLNLVPAGLPIGPLAWLGCSLLSGRMIQNLSLSSLFRRAPSLGCWLCSVSGQLCTVAGRDSF
jgi:hypothetical protein